MDRAGVVDALRNAPPWRKYEMDDPRLVRTGTDSAALVYVARAYGAGEDPAFVGAMSSVYVNSGNGWRLALYQQTPLPSAD